MLYRIEQEFTPELIISLVRLYGKSIKVLAKTNHEIIYIDTPRNRVIASGNWNMTPQELQSFIDGISRIDRRQYPFHTPSAFSMAFWKRNYGAEERFFVVNDDSFRYQMMREAVYGGRCEAYAIGTDDMEKYDINSSYPYHASRALLAIPGSLDYVTRGSLRNIAEYQGMSRITFTQDEYAPFLPTRIHNRIYYAVGEHTGTYTHSEIRYALENGLITNVRVEKQYIATDYENPLGDYMKDCYEKRKENKVWKMIANSLIGRLCARAEGVLEFRPMSRGEDMPERALTLRVSEPKEYKKPERHLYFKGISKSAQVRNNPLWAAEIYSMARITLYQAMMSAHMLKYVDTDCIMTDRLIEELAIGEQLGQWKKDVSRVSIYGAKQYQFGDKVVWKGVSEKSKKRNEIAFSVYTQERFINPKDGTTMPYSRSEAESAAIRNHRNDDSNPSGLGDS